MNCNEKCSVLCPFARMFVRRSFALFDYASTNFLTPDNQAWYSFSSLYSAKSGMKRAKLELMPRSCE